MILHINQAALEHCRSKDLMTCEPEELVDLRNVRIDTSLPVQQRLDGFVRQVGNPYLFKVDGLIVKAIYPPEANRKLSDTLPDLFRW